MFVQAQFFGWEMGLNQSLHRPYRDWAGEYLAFVVCAVAATLLALLTIRVLELAPFVASAVLRGWGVIAILTAPVCFVAIRYFQPDHFVNLRGQGWLWMDVLVGLVAVILVARRKWPISVATTVCLVTLHCLLWCRAFYITFAFRQPVALVIPILSSASLLTWGRWVRDIPQSGKTAMRLA